MERKNINSVIRSLRRVNLQGSLFGQTVAIRFGLTESDIEALEVLLDSGSATAGRLSELMGLTTGAVTRVIDRLEQAGYVRRVPDPADRRRVIVEIVARAGRGRRVDARPGEREERRRDRAVQRGGTRGHQRLPDEGRRHHARRRRPPCASRPMRRQHRGRREHAAPLGGLTRGSVPACVRARTRSTIRGSPRPFRSSIARASMDPSPRSGCGKARVTIQYKGGGLPWDWRKRNVER